MKIRKLALQNFRLFRELEIDFADEHLTVLIGGNGSGKSAVLDALAIQLSLLVGQLTSSTRSFNSQVGVGGNDINQEAESVTSTITLSLDAYTDSGLNDLTIRTNATRGEKGFNYDFSDERVLPVLHRLVVEGDRTSIPLVAYYRVGRTVPSVKSRKKNGKKPASELFYAYEHALTNQQSTFEDFTEWFIQEENLENQLKVREENLKYRLKSLDVVRGAVASFLSGFPSAVFGGLRVERGESQSPPRFTSMNGKDSYLVVDKDGVSIPLESLSSGERSLLLLVADIARRLYIANPVGDSLTGKGVVLIDEIELHLHPAWQRVVLSSLRKIFPNLQFIVTTHSPQVLSNVHEENVLIIDGGQVISASDPYGRDTNAILEELMGTPERPAEADKLLEETFALLANGSTDFASVEDNIALLRDLITEEDPVFLRLANIIQRKKLLSAS